MSPINRSNVRFSPPTPSGWATPLRSVAAVEESGSNLADENYAEKTRETLALKIVDLARETETLAECATPR